MKSLKFSNKNLFYNTVKRFRPMLVLFSIALCLCMPVVCMLVFSSEVSSNLYSVSLSNTAEALAHIIGREFLVASSAFGVFAGCTVRRYDMNRRSAVLLASLPVRREKLFAIEFGAGWVCYLGATAITLVFTAIVYLIYGVIGEIVWLLACVGAGFMWFFFFYALTLFIGMLCGMTSIQFLLTAVAVFYLPATLGLIVSLAGNTFYRFIDTSYYVSGVVLKSISPFIRLIYDLVESFIVEEPLDGIWPLYRGALIYFVAALVLSALCIPVLRKRKHERAGSPIMYSRVNGVVKYAVIVPCALLTGLIFYVTESVVSMIWGLAIGGVLSFMLMNVILEKNARAYFKGIKGFGIFAACFAVCFTLLAADPANMDEYIPSPAFTDRVHIALGNETVAFTEEEDIEAVNRIVKYAQTDDYSPHGYYDYYDYYGYDYGYQEGDDSYTYPLNAQYDNPMYGNADNYYMTVRVVYFPKVGLPISKYIYLDNISGVRDDVERLWNSSETRNAFIDVALAGDSDFADYANTGTLYVCTGGEVLSTDDENLYKGKMNLLLTELKKVDAPMYSDSMGPVVAVIEHGSGYTFPIYYNEAYAAVHTVIADTVEEPIPTEGLDLLLENVDKATVETAEGKQEYTAPEKIKELYLAGVGVHAWDIPYSLGDRVTFSDEEGTGNYYTYLYKAE